MMMSNVRPDPNVLTPMSNVQEHRVYKEKHNKRLHFDVSPRCGTTQ